MWLKAVQKIKFREELVMFVSVIKIFITVISFLRIKAEITKVRNFILELYFTSQTNDNIPQSGTQNILGKI